MDRRRRRANRRARPRGARAARRRLLAVGRRRRRRGGDRRRDLARARGRARGTRAVLVGRPRRRPDHHAAGQRRGRPPRAARPRRHRPLPRGPPRAGARRRAPRRRGLGRHEGRRRARARRAARARASPELFAEVALLLVCDEEWRAGDFVHVERFAGWDACLCFEGGELTADGDEAVVVRRKAAGTLRVLAHGRKAHSGSAPDKGANALLALASAAQAVASRHDPLGDAHLTAVPTVVQLRRGVQRRARRRRAAVRPARRRARDVRRRARRAARARRRRAPGERRSCASGRAWTRASRPRRCWLRRPSGSGARSSAPSAAGRATRATWRRTSRSRSTGWGRAAGGAHTPTEYIVEATLRSRAEVALAIATAVLGRASAALGDSSTVYEHQTCIRRERALGFRRSVISRIRVVLRRGAGEPLGGLRKPPGGESPL